MILPYSPIFLFLNFRWLDGVDILFVAILMYQLYKLVKGTVAIKIFLGILSIYIVWKIVEALQMDLLTEILGQFIGVGMLALIIVFQQEIRRFLLLVGSRSIFAQSKFTRKLFRWNRGDEEEEKLDVKAIARACFNLSKNKTGALIIISIDSELRYHASTGDAINATVSSALLEAIFFKNSPLHDGAVLIYKNTITSARCILPVSDNPDIPPTLGLRHRAAAGITENTPSMAVIVSEETGKISISKDGIINEDLSIEDLKKRLIVEFH